MTLKNRKEMKLTLTLPNEMIEEILLKLPVRSLLRFKCVCKSWLTLISNPQFAKSHYELAVAPTHRLLVKLNNEGSLGSIDIEAPVHDDSSVAYLTPPQSSLHYLRILGSCRGFVLLRYIGDGDLILWNPSTGARKTIPCSRRPKFLYGFGYDTSTDDYLVVIANLKTHMEFFSLKTNSWNKIKGINSSYLDIGLVYRAGLLLNGALHWLTLSNDTGTKVAVIIAFDLKERSLSEIPVPCDFTASKLLFEICNFMVIGGCLGLCCPGVCWVMKDYKVQSSWTKFIVSSNWCIPCNSDLPICFAKSGGIVGSDAIGKLMKLDDKGELLEISRYLVQFPPQSAIYRESLLSFPSDFAEAREDD